MATGEARIVLRARGALETLDLAFAFIRAHVGAYVRLLACLLPAVCLALAVRPHANGTRWGLFLAWLVLGIGDAAFTVLASRLVFNADVRVRDALRELARRLPALAWMRLLRGLAVIFSLFALIVPGVFVAMRWCFATEVLLLERASSTRALSRSKEIAVTDNGVAFGVAFGLPLLELLLGYGFASAARELLGGLMQAPALARWLAGAGDSVNYVGFALAQPLIATARLLFYLGTRSRIEGWDVQAAAAALHGAATTSPSLTRSAA